MEYLKQISLLCILIGPIFQLIFGWLSNNDRIKVSLNKITTISILLHFLFTIFGVRLIIYVLVNENNRRYVCGMPATGLIVVSGFLFMIMLIIIGILMHLKPKITWKEK